VVVENFRVGVTERLGVDFSSLRRVNPGLVYLSLASQGQHGPEARNASYGSTLDLLSGLASVTGYPGGPPLWSSYEVNYPDQLASMVGATLVVHLLERGVRGTHIDLSQRELVSWTLADQLTDAIAAGVSPGPTGNARTGHLVHQTVRTVDAGWVAVSCSDSATARALARLLGVDAHSAPTALESALERWAGALTRGDALQALQGSGVPAAPVLRADERIGTDHFSRRRVFVTSPGGVRVKGFPALLSFCRPELRSRAPRLGEHDREVDALFGVSSPDD
jgi:crotonobetainyl-CoA:carnitine CoA-transferase CaiB-like acyl-CoA transferase